MSATVGGAERVDLADRLAFVVGSVNRRLRPPAEGLTHVGISALASIARAGSIRSGDLARIEGIAAPGMTRLISDLEARRLIVRTADPDDGRSQLIVVTDEGHAALMRARQERSSAVAELLTGTGEAELAALVTAVGALESALLRTPAHQRSVRV